jgi:probable F420-dependent oxidoreductase
MTHLAFGVTLRGSVSLAAFHDVVRRADALGCDVIAAPDHLGAPDPFSTLTSAAGISLRVRLRTYVLNAGFWNPALLARAVATADLLSDGRIELGLGAGHMRSEYQDAGLPWLEPRARLQQLEATLVEVRRRLADPDHRPRPAQARIPVVVGAMSRAGLRVAARHADVVAFSGLFQVRGAPAGTFTIASAQEAEARVADVRRDAAGRAYRSDALLQAIVIGQEPTTAATRLAESFASVSTEQLLDSPFVLLARDPSHAAEIIADRRERFGFDSVMTHEPFLDELGRLIAAHRG